MTVFFNQLFDYNFYCNKKLIEECSKLKNVPENSIKLYSHILNAHHIWNANILGKPAEYETWQIHDIKAWGDIHYENQRSSFEIITNANDFLPTSRTVLSGRKSHHGSESSPVAVSACIANTAINIGGNQWTNARYPH